MIEFETEFSPLDLEMIDKIIFSLGFTSIILGLWSVLPKNNFLVLHIIFPDFILYYLPVV